MNMTLSKKVKLALAYAGVSQAELARRLDTTPQNFSSKIQLDTLKYADMEKIAEALGAKFECGFVFEDDERI